MKLSLSTTLLLALFLLLSLAAPAGPGSYAFQTAGAWPDEWQADSAFYRVWSRADEPVASRAAQRSWVWGPVPFAVANEEYAESSTGKRLVEYLDKARMEVNDPSGDRSAPWFVTTGLLVVEMVSGQVQTGNSRFEARPAADIPVAGDAGSSGAPTYADFGGAMAAAESRLGQAMDHRQVSRGGVVSPYTGTVAAPELFEIAHFDEVSRHNVPAVFRDWMGQTGPVLENGRTAQGPLLDPLYTLGRPITEAYWTDTLVGGRPATVLVQLFERRALTYNPANPPQWQVEMANVGRAYFDWRYGSQPPGPAVAAEVQREGVRVRGWNWPPSAQVQVSAQTPGGTSALSGPQGVTADAQGRFSLVLPLTPDLDSALASGGSVQVKAESGQAAAALPLAGGTSPQQVLLEGTLIQVEMAADGTRTLVLNDRDNKAWLLRLDDNSAVLYSEGDRAPASIVRAGMAVSVSGTAMGDMVAVSEMRLMSVSRTGARMGYSLEPDRRAIMVTGASWPPDAQVSLTLGFLNAGGPPPLATVRTDTRGNFAVRVPLPAAAAMPEGALWLFAVAAGQDRALAQVAVPFEPVTETPASEEPPRLYALAPAGEQLGGQGSYCWLTRCVDYRGVPLPPWPLAVQAGDAIAFRSQYGPDPDVGLTPNTFSAQVFPNDSSQVVEIDGRQFFTPSGESVYSTSGGPGRPFGLTLPQTLAPGSYAILVFVTWPDPQGGQGDASYGFSVTLRPEQLGQLLAR